MLSTTLTLLSILLLLVVVAAGWVMTLVGLPGNWFMLAVAAAYASLVEPERTVDIGWRWILALAILALIGELLEFVAGALGTAKAGGSRRSALYALVGSLIGGISGALLGTPIPVVGSLVAAIFFGGAGAAAGAVWGEWSSGRKLDHAVRVGRGAFWGRLLGVGGKVLVGSVMVAAIVVALCI